MVHYVYRNRPSGRLLIGKLFDRIYLGHKSWRAVRVRKRHVELLLGRAVRRQLRRTGQALVLDVASGQAQYLLDTLARFAGQNVQAICWDLEDRWLAEGRQAAEALGLRGVFFTRRDALDQASFRRLLFSPHVVVASGFYDWIEDDELVARSMRLIHDALAPGGRFLFTVQTGHADLRMANEIFPHFDGGPLRMKTRPAAAVCAWARQAGFAVERTLADQWGYYAVTLARKAAGL